MYVFSFTLFVLLCCAVALCHTLSVYFSSLFFLHSCNVQLFVAAVRNQFAGHLFFSTTSFHFLLAIQNIYDEATKKIHKIISSDTIRATARSLTDNTLMCVLLFFCLSLFSLLSFFSMPQQSNLLHEKRKQSQSDGEKSQRKK